jgi:hypothetical protein
VVVLTTLLTISMTMLPTRALAAIQQLSCSPASLSYGNVTVGQTKTLLVTVTNKGPASLTISTVTVVNNEFTTSKLKLPLVLAAGASFDVSVIFAPRSTGSADGEVSFASASNPTFDLLIGGSGVAGETVTATPPSLAFGNVAVGAGSTVPVVLTNAGTSAVTLSSLQTTGSAFSVSGANFPLTLAAGKTLKLTATFTPQAAGLASGSAFVSGPSLTVPLTGTGTASTQPELTFAPTTLSFGNVAVGITDSLTLGLNATGASVTISSLSSSNSQFAVPGVDLPLTVPVGKEVSLNVTFTPKNNGTASGTLSFHSNATNTASEPLSGTGTAPYVSLSWIASSSQVSGYNVYRSTSKTGSYTKMNSKLDPDTTYSDATVVSGSTYYYATTAVNSSGKESTYSDQVTVVVP